MTDERPLLGGAILFAGITCAAMMDVAAKVMSVDVPVWQLVWARFFFHCLLLTPLAFFIWRRQPPTTHTNIGRKTRWGIHILRGFLLTLSSVFFFLAIRDNPVPDSLAIFFIEPLIVMLMARFFLQEQFDRKLLFSAIMGIVGVLIILRPGGDYEWTILFALAAAVSFGGYIVAARFASRSMPAPITSWLTAFFGMLPTLPAIFFLHEVDAAGWLLMAFVGLMAGIGHTLIILSLKYLRASLLAVLHYSEVGIAAILSWIVFSHWPDAAVWSGISLIAVANLYALRATSKKNRAAPAPPAEPPM